MTPIGRRRLQNFRANRRGVWSLRLFLGMLAISLCAEWVANDRPLLLVKGASVHLPVLFDYTEADLGGSLDILADYRDPLVRALIENDAGWMLWPPVPFSYDTIDWAVSTPTPTPPGQDGHLLGTDELGRDLLAMLLHAFRLSVLFGLALTALSTAIGVAAGAVQGYFGGNVDLLGQRLMEIWAGLPVLFLLIILTSLVEANALWLLAILGLFSWMPLVGVVRAEFLRARNLDFVRAARCLGVGDLAIMWRHVLPNAMVATLTYLPFILTGAITSLTALDFLGFGLPIEAPSLGRLLAQAKANLDAPWIGASVFVTLAAMLTLLIFIGEAVRDAFDPRRSTSLTGSAPAGNAPS